MLPAGNGEAVTHDGNFHLDDVAAAAVLMKAGWSVSRESRDTRARPGVLYFDTGGVYDPDRLMFDHHMDNPPTRKSGVLKSAMTLVWDRFGDAYVTQVLPNAPPAERSYAEARVRRTFEDLDLHSSRMFKKMEKPPILGTVSSMVAAFVPVTEDVAEMNAAFFRAAGWFGEFLESMVLNSSGRHAGVQETLKHLRNGDGWRGGVLILPRFAPFGEALNRMAKEDEKGVRSVRYVIYPGGDGNFRISPYGYKTRPTRKFPRAWSSVGRDRKRLQVVAGTTSAKYILPDGGLGVATDIRGAVCMALNAIRFDETGTMPSMDAPPVAKLAEVKVEESEKMPRSIPVADWNTPVVRIVTLPAGAEPVSFVVDDILTKLLEGLVVTVATDTIS